MMLGHYCLNEPHPPNKQKRITPFLALIRRTFVLNFLGVLKETVVGKAFPDGMSPLTLTAQGILSSLLNDCQRLV